MPQTLTRVLSASGTDTPVSHCAVSIQAWATRVNAHDSTNISKKSSEGLPFSTEAAASSVATKP